MMNGQAIAIGNIEFAAYCAHLRDSLPVNRRVLFIQIPQFLLSSFSTDVAKRKGYYAFPPTGLQCLYESVKTRNLEFRILDLSIEILKQAVDDPNFDIACWTDILDETLDQFDPYIVGVSCMFDSGIAPLLDILGHLKSRNKSIAIAGGVIPTYEWKQLLDRELSHFVVHGEGENKLNFLLDHLTNENHKFASTPGIHFRYAGQFCETAGVPDTVIPEGDLVDSYKLIRILDYSDYGSLNPFSRMAGKKNPAFAAIQLNRGCRGKCTFCSVRDFMGKGVRARGVDEVLAEMEFLVTRHNVRHFEWLDDDLLMYKEELAYLLQSVIDRNWDITWAANNGLLAISLDKNLLRLMRDSGCIGFKIGIETGNADVLKSVRKPGTLETFRRASLLLKDYPEIFVGGNYIVGFPGETFGQMMDTFRFQLRMELDWSAFTMCQVIRGASAFNDFADYFTDQMASDGKITHNFIPTREAVGNKLEAGTDIHKGPRVFQLPLGYVPDEAQIKEIWFTFNLTGNYIFNKNLLPGGSPQKFISWVEMAQVAYPNNAYMSLFLGLAYQLLNETGTARQFHFRVVSQLDDEYWRERFSDFGLSFIVDTFPQTSADAANAIFELRHIATSWI